MSLVELRGLLERLRDDPFAEKVHVAIALWCRSEGLTVTAAALITTDDEGRMVPAPGKIWQEVLPRLRALSEAVIMLESRSSRMSSDP
jgi:hypothetical protein